MGTKRKWLAILLTFCLQEISIAGELYDKLFIGASTGITYPYGGNTSENYNLGRPFTISLKYLDIFNSQQNTQSNPNVNSKNESQEESKSIYCNLGLDLGYYDARYDKKNAIERTVSDFYGISILIVPFEGYICLKDKLSAGCKFSLGISNQKGWRPKKDLWYGRFQWTLCPRIQYEISEAFLFESGLSLSRVYYIINDTSDYQDWMTIDLGVYYRLRSLFKHRKIE